MAVTVGVLAYDIADTRRRNGVRRLLEAYGVPVQESVFVLDLSSAKWAEVERKLRAVVSRAEDDVRVWPLCVACQARARVWCGVARGAPGPVLIL